MVRADVTPVHALPMSWPSAVLTIVVTLLVILLPGLVVGLAAGLRGWLLAAGAPLLTYAVGGLTGPWLDEAGLPFNAWTFAAATGMFAAVAAGVAALGRRRARWSPALAPPEPTPWRPRAHAAVVGCVVVGAVAGGYAALQGMGRLDAIPQDWDAVFHANGIRLIAESGNGGLYAMSELNKYGDGAALYYPNAYHLIAAVAFTLTGAPIPAILNASSVLLPGLVALSLVAMVREFRGRAVLACSVALLAVAPATLLYASMARGPLLPFLLGLALLPVGAAVLRRFLDQPAPGTGLVLALCAAGLLAIHPSMLLSCVLFGLPMLGQRWFGGTLRRVGADLAALAVVAVVAAALAVPQLLGALQRPAADGLMQWPVTHDVNSAVGALLVFQHTEPHPQVWLTVALALGIVFCGRLGALRWVAGSAVLFGGLWLVVATSEAAIVVELSQPWWNDPWRFIALATLPLTVLAANGLAETQAWLRDRLTAVRRERSAVSGSRARLAGAAAAAIVLLAFAVVSNVLYTGYNATVVSTGYRASGPWMPAREVRVPAQDVWVPALGVQVPAHQVGVPAHQLRLPAEQVRVSDDEVRAMHQLGKLAAPGDWAMNDRFDGTVWTYAISGVRTVAAHYDTVRLSDDAYLLDEAFRRYPEDPAVRAAVERLNVRWVIVGKHGFIRDKVRAPGLVGYDDLQFLTKVYENPGAAIYRLTPAA